MHYNSGKMLHFGIILGTTPNVQMSKYDTAHGHTEGDKMTHTQTLVSVFAVCITMHTF